MNFNFEEFTQNVFKQFNDTFTLDEVRGLLDISKDYGFDKFHTNTSRLFLRNIQFRGVKTDGEVINFSQELKSGITMWIADNLKGKSSLFKIIRFALTGGHGSMKTDVKKWIREILLNFNINEDKYCIYLDQRSARLSAKLFNNHIYSYEEASESTSELVFNINNFNKYEPAIQEFFFEKFDYYTLNWTSQASQKDRIELKERKTSWKTYYNSIYLQAKDTISLMYGDQEKKVFQMLLGLELTYPINRLTVKKDLLEHEGAKNKSTISLVSKDDGETEESLSKRVDEIDKLLLSPSEQSRENVNATALYEEYERITNQIKNAHSRELALDNDFRIKTRKLNVIGAQLDTTQAELKRIIKEIENTKKRVVDLEEYIEIGIFFSNLDIKHCPNCNHSVSESKKKIELENKTCSLCSESINVDENGADSIIYREKIKSLTLAIEKFLQEEINIRKKIDNLQGEFNLTDNEVKSLDKDRKLLGDTKPLKNRLAIIETNINKEKEKVNPINTERESLIAERAVKSFRLKEFEVEKNKQNKLVEDQIRLLKYAIRELDNIQYELSERILNRLSELMLTEIKGFGVNITDVKIDNNFNVLYEQDGDLITFDKIAEGEQLRAKLAFYLSLIQLEVEEKAGRHSKLLIIDSPAREEGDANYLEGLSEVLTNIDERFGDKLQILIGTAERKLAGVASNEHVFPQNEFLF